MISISKFPIAARTLRTGLSLGVSLFLVLISSRAVAQGNVGALSLQRQFEKQYADSLKAKRTSQKTIQEKLQTYETTGDSDSTGENLSAAGIVGEANLALIEDASVKPAVMAKAMFRKRDYLYMMAQLLFGDTSVEPKPASVSTNLFVPEASRYALNIMGSWRPRSDMKTAKEFAVNFGFYYALKELPADSTQSLQNVGVMHAHAGVEYVVYRGGLSIYLDGHILSNQQDEDVYRAYFGNDVEQTFMYVAPGIRVKFSDKLFVDLELTVMTDDMKKLRGTDDGVMPLFRLGFSQSIFAFD